MKGNIVKKRGEKGRRLAWLSKSFLSINPLSPESVSQICSCCHFTSLTHTHTTPHALTELIDDRLSLHSILPAAVSSQRLHQTTGTFTFAHHHKHPHTHTQPCTHILLTYQHSILLFLSSNHSLSLFLSRTHTHTRRTPYARTEMMEDSLSPSSILPAAVISQTLHQTTGADVYSPCLLEQSGRVRQPVQGDKCLFT